MLFVVIEAPQFWLLSAHTMIAVVNAFILNFSTPSLLCNACPSTTLGKREKKKELQESVGEWIETESVTRLWIALIVQNMMLFLPATVIHSTLIQSDTPTQRLCGGRDWPLLNSRKPELHFQNRFCDVDRRRGLKGKKRKALTCLLKYWVMALIWNSFHF